MVVKTYREIIKMICEWVPNHDPYTGSAQTAIMSYVDIPLETRKTLIEKVKRNAYTDVLSITRDSITGQFTYRPEITSMHFGSKAKVCKTVSRAKWSDIETQGAIAFCEAGTCVIRPSVCNNWSRVILTVIAARLEQASTVPPETTQTETSTGFPDNTTPDANSFQATAIDTDTAADSLYVSNMSGGYGSFGDSSGFSAPCPCAIPLVPVCPPLVSTVGEPTIFWLMVLGLSFVMFRKFKIL